MLILALVLAVAALPLAPRAAAPLGKPRYAAGDFWTYATDVTEAFGLQLVGNTTVEAGNVATVRIGAADILALEVLLFGGGTFSAQFPGVGAVAGTWTATGTESWETEGWKAVRSFLRLSASGELGGPPPLAFTMELVNDTTREITSDTWPWPIREGTSGSVTARATIMQNLTIQFSGFPPESNETQIEGTYVTNSEHLRTERVTVPAGTFDAHVVREDRPEGGHLLRWFSARAGNDVRQEGYNETGALVLSSDLVDYRYAAGVPPPEFPWLLVIVAALAATAVVLGVLSVIRRRRRPPSEVWMPDEPTEGPPSQ